MLLITALTLSGCFNPDDLIPIRGSVDAPGQRVELLRAPACDDAWKLLKDTTANDDGTFQFEVFRAQVQTLSNLRQQCLRVQTTFPSGTRTASTVRALELTADLPKFIDWRTELSFDGGTVQFDALDAGEFAATHVAELRSSDGGVVWTQADQRVDETGTHAAPIDIDERVLHEFGGQLSLVATYGIISNLATAPVVTQQELVTVHPDASLEFDATVVPLSRGGACDELPSPCVLTDGRLDENDFSNARVLPTLTIRFLAPAAPTLLVARDLSLTGGGFELGDDGQTIIASWRTLQVLGLTADGRELDLGTSKFFFDTNEPFDPRAPPQMTFRGRGLWLALSLSPPEPLVGVRLKNSWFMAAQEVSVF